MTFFRILTAGVMLAIGVQGVRAEEPVPLVLPEAIPDMALPEPEPDALEVYGFADFTYQKPGWGPKSIWVYLNLPPHDSFAVGNFNLYLSKKLSSRCSTLGEVRFLYEPNGAPDGAKRINTNVPDHADVERPIPWGGIRIERVYVDCQIHPLLTIRAGHWLTPYGIWNVDHGTPTIISIRRPYVVGDELFPSGQTGLQFMGGKNLGDFRLGYSLTLSNGRGAMDTHRDLDSNKGLGGRLELEYSRFGDWKVGLSYYRGRYTNTNPATYDSTKHEAVVPITSQYDEQAIGADLRGDWRGLVLRSEFVYNEQLFTAAGRPLSNNQYVPNQRRHGYYALLGYRTGFYDILPFAVYEYFRFQDAPGYALVDAVRALHLGVNVLLTPNLVFKMEGLYSQLPGNTPDYITDFMMFQAQLAWAF